MMNDKKRFYFDLVERTVWTFVQAFASAYVTPALFPVEMLEPIQNLSFAGKLTFAAGAGVVAVLKSLASNKLPWTADDSASSLPESVDPPVDEKAKRSS